VSDTQPETTFGLPTPHEVARKLEKAVEADLRNSTPETRIEVARLTALYREARAQSETQLEFQSRVHKAFSAIAYPPKPQPTTEHKKAESIIKRGGELFLRLWWIAFGVCAYEAVKWLVTR
jgi:hypothetical protein